MGRKKMNSGRSVSLFLNSQSAIPNSQSLCSMPYAVLLRLGLGLALEFIKLLSQEPQMVSHLLRLLIA